MSSKEALCTKETSAYNRYKTEYIVTLAVAVCMLNVGINSGWPGPIIGVLTNPESEFHIELADTAWLSSLYMIGNIFGAIIGFVLTKYWSRSKTIFITSILYQVGYLIFLLYQKLYPYYVGRILTGIGTGISFGAATMYVAELASPEIRGFLLAILTVASGLGEVLVYVAVPLMNITTINYLFCTIALLQFIFTWFIPESPYFLLTSTNRNEAKKVFMKLRGRKDVDEELNCALSYVKDQSSQPASFYLVFTNAINRRSLFLASLALLSQPLSGGVTLLTYSQRIFETKAQFLSKELSGIIFSVCKLVPMFTAGLIIEKFGRKPLLVGSALTCAVPLFILGSFFHFEESENDFVISNLNFIPLVTLLIHIGFYGIGTGSVPGTYIAEIVVSPTIRPHLFCVLAMIIGFFSFLSIQVFNYLDREFGKGTPMFFFAGASLVSGILMAILLIETAGKTFNEIEKKLSQKR